MRDDPIERALRDDAGVVPSPGFAGRVMVSVRHAARERAALTFPWRRLAWGLCASAAVTVAGLLSAPPPDLQALARAATDSGLAAAAPWLAGAFLLSFFPAWWSFRLADRCG